MTKKHKGNILLVTLITCIVMSSFALLALNIVSRYDRSIRSRFEDLQTEVYDDTTSKETNPKVQELNLNIKGENTIR